MNNVFHRLILGVTLAVSSANLASAQQLGASYQDVRAHYASARPAMLTTGERVLEIVETDYAGVRWARIDFIFGSGGRLSQLTMSTRKADYQAVLALAQRQNTTPSLNQAAEDRTGDLQIRVCESGDGEVSLTYESLSVAG